MVAVLEIALDSQQIIDTSAPAAASGSDAGVATETQTRAECGRFVAVNV